MYFWNATAIQIIYSSFFFSFFIILGLDNHKCSQTHTHQGDMPPCNMTHINESDLFSSTRDTNGRTMWEITSNYSFAYRLIAVYVQILVLLPSWNCRLWSLVNSVSTAITSYLICMSNESGERTPPSTPLIYQSITVTAIE